MTKPGQPKTGRTQSAGWQVGMRRTLPIGLEDAWHLLISAEGIAIWLGEGADIQMQERSRYRLADGTSGEVRVIKLYSNLRITWHPPAWQHPSTLQLRLIGKGNRTVLALHQEHLPGPDARNERRRFFGMALDALEKLANKPSA